MCQYYTCPDCGANLDPGEKCDCKSLSEVIAEAELEREYAKKKEVIVRLKLLLLICNVELADLQLLDTNTVEATYISGNTRKINISMDSPIAIVRDVTRHII